MAAESLPTSVRCFVASEADEASRNQRDALLALASWESDVSFGGRNSWRWRDTILVTIPEHHLYRDHLDRDLEAAFGQRTDLVVYLSKHVSESRRPSLTVHPIGNPRGAEFGGQPETLVPSAPRWMTAALRGLRKEARGLPYNVTFEATHHGPYLTTPTFYIEQGSTETEWADVAASRAIARVLLALEPVDAPIAIGLGGGHYVPRPTDLALQRRIAFGHLLAAYALEGASANAIDQAVERTEGATLAYLHRKSLSKPDVRAFEEHLETRGLRIIREADLDPERENETSGSVTSGLMP
ncbi:MAG TPA: D-aminoacyl-tRNA deacylase [Thermoplasmata archaeon]|nr:D-aminoacyl-tRNA deacylase [Thermoplasmata archaeon]